jgi:hypothetical protein
MANQIDFAEVEQFAGLFPAGECPKFPQSVADLPENLTQREMIRSAMPQLWERLHGGAENQLPADVLLRMHRNELGMGDVEALRSAGMEAAALTVEARAKEQAMADFIAKAEAEAEARAAAAEIARANNEMSLMESAALAQRQLAAQNRRF